MMPIDSIETLGRIARQRSPTGAKARASIRHLLREPVKALLRDWGARDLDAQCPWCWCLLAWNEHTRDCQLGNCLGEVTRERP